MGQEGGQQIVSGDVFLLFQSRFYRLSKLVVHQHVHVPPVDAVVVLPRCHVLCSALIMLEQNVTMFTPEPHRHKMMMMMKIWTMMKTLNDFSKFMYFTTEAR